MNHDSDIGKDASRFFRCPDTYTRRYLGRWGSLGPEPRVTRLVLREVGRRAGVFVDVGAHVGWYACTIARAYSHVMVYAVEMDRLHARVLARNARINQIRNLRLERVALGDRTGCVRYGRARAQPDPSLSTMSVGGMWEYVRVVTLDELMRARRASPTVIKVDVEGDELHVLRGAVNTLRRARPTLFVELHRRELQARGHSVGDVVEFLRLNGYRVEMIEDMHGHAQSTRLIELVAGMRVPGNAMVAAAPL